MASGADDDPSPTGVVATEETGTGRRRRRRERSRVVVQILTAVAVSVVVVLGVVALRDRADAVAALDVALPHVGWLLACVVANVAGNAVLTDAWRVGVRLAGHDLPFAVAGRVWGTSQFSRFLFPGATVGARAGLGRRHGVPAGVGAATTLVEFALSLAVSPTLLLATLPWWLDELPAGLGWVPWTAAVPVALVVALLVAPMGTLQLVARGLGAVPVLRDRAVRGAAALQDVTLDRSTTVGLVARYLLNVVLRLAGFLALVVGATGGRLDRDALLLAVGAYAVGRFVGRIALFAPGGVGPREGATVVVLGPLLGLGGATLVVVVERLLELVAEVVLLGLCALALARRPGR